MSVPLLGDAPGLIALALDLAALITLALPLNSLSVVVDGWLIVVEGLPVGGGGAGGWSAWAGWRGWEGVPAPEVGSGA